MRRQTDRQTKPNTIAFRVDTEMLAAIDKQCLQLGISRGEFARAVLGIHFEVEPARLLERVSGIERKINRLSKNQARSLVTLLTRVGTLSLDEAKEVIRAHLVH